MTQYRQVRLDVEHLRDGIFDQKYKRALTESFGELKGSDDPKKFWTHFKAQILEVSASCPYAWNIQEISDQENPKHHRGESLEGKTRQHRELKRGVAERGASPWSLRSSGKPRVAT